MEKSEKPKDCADCGGIDTMIKRGLNMGNGKLIYECKECFNTEEVKT